MKMRRVPAPSVAKDRANTAFLGGKLKLNIYKTRAEGISPLEKERMAYLRR
jgi:hypothetical protein